MGAQQMPVLARRPAALLRFFGSAACALSSWSLRVSDRLQLWQERKRQRRALSGINDHMLKDLGLSRSDIAMECGKRFWEV